MRVVWASPYLPVPITTGGRRRIGSLMRRLSGRHEISLVAYDRGEVPKAADETRSLVRGVWTVRRRPTRSLFNAAVWAVGPWPFMAVANGFNGAMVRRMKEVVDQVRPDILHCEHFHLWQAVSRARGPHWPPVVLSQQGVEYLVTARFASLPRNPLLRIGLRAELAKARRWEIAACRAADMVVVVSERDREVLGDYVPPERIAVVENGVDLEEFHPREWGVDDGSARMLFMGTFSFFGNRDALRYLVADILPAVRRVRPDATLRVIGDDPPVLGADGVECVGTVADVGVHLREARLLIAPLRTGSGTKLKILEAMASGVPFVTTSYGIEGIEGAAEAGIVADDTHGLVEAVLRLLGDRDVARQLGERGRRIVERSHSWDASAHALEAAWERARERGGSDGCLGRGA